MLPFMAYTMPFPIYKCKGTFATILLPLKLPGTIRNATKSFKKAGRLAKNGPLI
jgi:hypothetical protein